MKVPFVSLSREADSIKDQLISKTEEVLRSGMYIQSDNLKSFESSFALICKANFAKINLLIFTFFPFLLIYLKYLLISLP